MHTIVYTGFNDPITWFFIGGSVVLLVLIWLERG